MRAVSRQLAVLNSRDENGPGRIPPEPEPRRRRDRLGQRVAGFIERQPGWLVFTVGVILLALVGWADYLAGAGLSFTPFYLVPVALVTWAMGRGVGVAMALAATFSWSLAFVSVGAGVAWD